MRNFKKYFFLLSFFSLFAMQNDKPAYLLYEKEGKQTSYAELLKAAQNADIVLFGELHNNPICHWLQLKLTKDLFKQKGANLVLAAEMFETDNQLVLNEYLSGFIKEANFEKESKLWNNYKTDYRPLVEFAKQNKIPFVASNIPRRYASMVAGGGFEALTKLDGKATSLIAPMPIKMDTTLATYQSMYKMMGGGHGGTNGWNIVYAQASKDATMAYKIVENWKKDKTLLHFHGAFHSDKFEGIVWYLNSYKPNLKIVTISSVEQEDVSVLKSESFNLANFVICIDAEMTKTY
ncbi:MAG: iron-regulated protein [Cytophagales bacterium]|nr:MAG: iron-regulated protein [Cytophagales bacterium]